MPTFLYLTAGEEKETDRRIWKYFDVFTYLNNGIILVVEIRVTFIIAYSLIKDK
jgi:hypothetical protein